MLLCLNECDLDFWWLEVFALVSGTADGLHNHLQHLIVMPPIATFNKCFGTVDVVSFSPPDHQIACPLLVHAPCSLRTTICLAHSSSTPGSFWTQSRLSLPLMLLNN